MNTIWLKLAGAVVAIIVVLVVVGQFTGNKSPSTPAPAAQGEQTRTVYDSFARDDKKFGVKFEGQEQPEPNAAAQAAAPTPQTPVAQTPVAQAPPQPQKQLYFEKLPIEAEVEAQRLHSMALEERKRSRLPGMTAKGMVDYCRQIILKWPRSEYAYKAKLMLADIPERFKEMYKVTPKETDVSSFYK
jgi:hypothetical protein